MKKYLFIIALLGIITLSWCWSVRHTYTYEYDCNNTIAQWFTYERNDGKAMYFILDAWKKLSNKCVLKYIKRDGKDIFRSEFVN